MFVEKVYADGTVEKIQAVNVTRASKMLGIARQTFYNSYRKKLIPREIGKRNFYLVPDLLALRRIPA